MNQEQSNSLAALRAELDRIDDEILELIERRLSASAGIAAAKGMDGDRHLKVRPRRQQQILDRLKARTRRASPALVEAVWREIMALSLQAQARTELVLAPSDHPQLLEARVRAHFGSAPPICWADSAEDAIRRAVDGEAIAILPDQMPSINGELRLLDVLKADDGSAVAFAVGRVCADEALVDEPAPKAEIRPPDNRLSGSRVEALRGDVKVPGDKSMSHRALILGGLASGETRISGLLEGDDVLHTADAVRALGADVERLGQGEWRVRGAEWRSPSAPVDCGNSGTGARLLMGAVAGFPISVTFTGDASLSSRPMERVLGPLRAMGARTEGSKLPVTIHGGDLHGTSFVNEKASAQVKSAILLAGLRAAGEVEVIEPALSRDHSENMLRAFGCEVTNDGGFIRLGDRRKLIATDVSIPGDPSSAAFPIVAALIVPGSEVTVRDIMVNPLRTGLFTTLREMGADLRLENQRSHGGEAVADLVVRHSRLHGVEVPASRAPSMIDEYPIMAVAAAFAQGRSVMHGLAELRVKESDRLAAVVAGLKACGVEAWEDGDSMVVEGRGSPPRGGAEVQAHHDHRIAMSFLCLGLASEQPVTVDSADMIATSFPTFVSLMLSLGARIA